MDDSLNEDQRRKLAAMIGLREEFEAVQASRIAVLVRAAARIMAGTLTVGQVCQALGCSERTWHRWAAQYELRELAVVAVAELDAALREAGADAETTAADVRDNPDLAFAAGVAGVWPR